MKPISPSIFSFAPISKDVQQHLKNVYLTLGISLLSATLGVFAHLKFAIGSATFLCSLCGVGSLLFLLATPTQRDNLAQRLVLLLGFSFFQGVLLGPLVQLALILEPSLIFIALSSTVVIFACFSLASIMANNQRTYLYWGGALSSALSTLFWMSFLGMFFHSPLNLTIQIYGGLLLFIGYVLYDTQLIILKSENGDNDFVKHSVELFIDFVAIFVRILIILLKNSQKDKKNNSR